jgi:hypothetical protein
LALIAALPVIAGLATLGASSPAMAWSAPATCNNFQVCYYANANYGPSSSVLNIGQEDNSNWANIPDNGRVCGGIVTHTWNDCASSIKDRMTSYYMCNYANADYAGPYLEAAPGDSFSNLVNDEFNDEISSNKFVGATTPC